MTARLVSGEVIGDPRPAPTKLRYLEEVQPTPSVTQWATAYLTVGCLRLIGYAIAWAVILGLAFTACNAATADRPGETPYVLPTFDLYAPLGPAATTVAPVKATKPTKAPKRSAAAVAADPAVDCGGADPADPEIDPEYDCAP